MDALARHAVRLWPIFRATEVLETDKTPQNRMVEPFSSDRFATLTPQPRVDDEWRAVRDQAGVCGQDRREGEPGAPGRAERGRRHARPDHGDAEGRRRDRLHRLREVLDAAPGGAHGGQPRIHGEGEPSPPPSCRSSRPGASSRPQCAAARDRIDAWTEGRREAALRVCRRRARGSGPGRPTSRARGGRDARAAAPSRRPGRAGFART